jgi:chromate transporter
MKPSYKLLFLSFFRLGITSFGGPAMVAYIRKMVVEEKKWLQSDDFNQGVALCQTLPGMTAMQSTAYSGMRIAGIPGAFVCFTAFVLPSFIMMVIASYIFIYTQKFEVSGIVVNSLKSVVVALIANAAILFSLSTMKKYYDSLLVILAGTLHFIGFNPFLLILVSAIGGFLVRKMEKQSLPNIYTKVEMKYWYHFILVFITSFLVFVLLFIFNSPLFELASLMAKIDLVAFGGGFSSVPLMFHEIVEKRNWMDNSTFMAGIALGQVTPGPIAITATFAGVVLFGFKGAVVATFGILSPSFLMLTGIAPVFDRIRTNRWFNPLVTGILLSFVGLLFSVCIKFGLLVHWQSFNILLALASFVALQLKFSLPLVVLFSFILSLLFAFL